MKHFFLTILFAWIFVGFASAEVLLYDDFNTGIDATVWNTPKNTGNYDKQTTWNSTAKAAQLTGRSLLATVEDFNPADYYGIATSGIIKHTSGNTFFSAISWSDGLNSSASSGIVNTGLELRYRSDQNNYTGNWRESGTGLASAVTLVATKYSTGTTPAEITTYASDGSGLVYDFVDNGAGLASLKFTSVTDSTKQWQALYSYDTSKVTPGNLSLGKIAFQNHEGGTDLVDNVQISALRGGFTDTFDGPNLDLMNWTTRGGSQSGVVIDSQGRLTLTNRSGVATRTEYTPLKIMNGENYALNVSGDLVFGTDDMISIFTRSDNSNTMQSSHVNNGLQFQMNILNGQQTLNLFQKGANFNITELEVDRDIRFEVGKTYHFDIFDDGTFASLHVYDVLDTTNSGFMSVLAERVDGSTYDSNYFVMYNREGARTSYVDNLSLSYSGTTVPEPSTLGMLLLGVLALFRMRKKG